MRKALTTKDRCDRCGAQAYAITHHSTGHLHWCKHHYRQHEDRLAPDLVFYSDADQISETQEVAV